MGSIWLKRRRFYCEYVDHAGVRQQVRLDARTKLEAKGLLAELEAQARRRRLGLEALPQENRITLGEACTWWLEKKCPPLSRSSETSRMKHVLEHRIAKVPLAELTADAIDERLQEMEKAGYSPASVNALRKAIRTVINRARKSKKWAGENPVADVPLRHVPRKHQETIQNEDEVRALVRELSPYWRDYMMTALYSGARKGELAALKKADVDLELRVLWFRASWESPTTKARREDPVPIAPPMLPYLRHAIEASPSDLVFPGHDSGMRSRHEKPEGALRRALARAGLLAGWRFTCRRCKHLGREGHTTTHQDAQERRCEACGMRLWASPIPRAMKFHGLRHSTGTLLLRAGVDVHRVQRVLRHADVEMTTGTYSHLLLADLAESVAKLPSAPTPAEFPTRALPEKSAPRGPSKGSAKRAKLRGEVAGDAGVEPAAFGSGGLPGAIEHPAAADGNQRNHAAFLGAALAPAVRVVATESTPERNFPTRPLPAAVRHPLLTVRDVAAALAVSTATVYGLVERGELPHVRVSGAIRVEPEDLQAYLARGRR